MAKISINAPGISDYIQQGYLHIIASGSDGSDGSASGYHLRWSLLGNLGDKHLPKGNLSTSGNYQTSIAYNKSGDALTVYRVAYDVNAYRTTVNFQNTPDLITVSGTVREWQYDNLIPVSSITSNTNSVIIRFLDLALYDYWASQYDPASSPLDFLINYSGVIEAFVVGKSFFSARFTLVGNSGFTTTAFRCEAVAIPSTLNPDDRIVCHRIYETDKITTSEARGENINHVRYQHTAQHVTQIEFQCYHDYVLGANQHSAAGAWVKVDSFSLSTSDAVIADLLEDTSRFTINNSWPRYFESNSSTGAYTVKRANYLDKWAPSSDPGSGIKGALLNYLSGSVTDVYANASLASDSQGDSTHFDISYLNLLKYMAIDFHVARMLGLGYIDTPVEDLTYIYAATYRTLKDPSDETVTLATSHVSLSLPTAKTSYRLPLDPMLDGISYGLSVNNGSGNPTLLSDENGYALYDDVRFVNINKKEYPYEKALGSFFDSINQFCLADFSRPVLFGIKYKLTQEANWQSPEISNDSAYQDQAGISEVVPFPETSNPVFVHQEREEGEHSYAVYGINLFSRVSALSNELNTDETAFPARRTLQPPANFAVQLIQKEEPLIFTTSDEQNLLDSITATDKTLVRATFNWDEAHNIAYQVADKVNFYHRVDPPLTVRGTITGITNLSDNRVRITTGSFTITSSNPAQVITPVISLGTSSRFEGSLLASNNQLFEVEAVASTGSNPSLILKKIRTTQSVEFPIGSNNFITTESYVTPAVGDVFMLVENMSSTENWDTKLLKQVDIISFSPVHSETITLGDGSQKVLTYGGVFRSALLAHVYNPSAPNVATGVYSITYSNFSLPAHTDNAVSWYKGSVRVVTEAATNTKKLEVWNIETQGNDLKLTVFDPDFQNDPILNNLPAHTRTVNVNFHPGYRVYLYADSQNATSFIGTSILPLTGEGNKITYLAAEAIDSTQNPDLASALTTPAPLYAREIIVPVAPEALNGPQYATRPNVYGKSTYTFDIKLDTTNGRVPFGITCHRGSDRQILGLLYEQSTLTAVINSLAALNGDDAAFYEQRILDLLNGNIDPSTGTFKKYGTGTYRLPLPNNADISIPDPQDTSVLIAPFDGNTTLADLVSSGALQSALTHHFLPLTEQPIIYRYLKSGRKTSSRKPLFRDSNGQIITPILPSDPNYDENVFDPFPMAVTYSESGDTFVRFTDYTLDGAANGIYFYFAVEFSNDSKISPRSPMLGAVRLVNTLAPEAPQLKKVTTRLANEAPEFSTAVRFEIDAYLPSENIGEYRIYRSLNATDASSVRTMTLAATIPAGYSLVDSFADLANPPYGELLCYRIVAVRFTKDENGNLLKVASQPSNIALTNIVDVVNPKAPQLSSFNGTSTTSQLQDVILRWEPTTYNADYTLQKQDDNGHWRSIFTIRSNSLMQYPPLDPSGLPDFANHPETAALERIDIWGKPLYHRFRIQVINSSGLINYTYNPITLAQGASDLQRLDAIVKYKDSSYSIIPLRSERIDEGVSNPISMKFDNLLVELPAGHNLFIETAITVSDDLGNSFTKTITPNTQSVTFNHGDGGLVLNTSNPNRSYKIRTITKTDFCNEGALRIFELKYVSSPCNDLGKLSEILSYTDSSHTIILSEGHINDGVSHPGQMIFTDITNLSVIGQTFNGVNITVSDDLGNSFTKQINAASPGSSVTFNHNEGGLVFDSSNPNRIYTINATLFSDLCSTGKVFSYKLNYSFTHCSELSTISGLVNFSDNNSTSLSPLVTTDISGTNHSGGSMRFDDIISSILPQGHSFNRLDVILEDGIGGIAVKSINSSLSSVTFTHGDGNLQLDGSIPNLVYHITLVLYTSLCIRGTAFRYRIAYVV